MQSAKFLTFLFLQKRENYILFIPRANTDEGFLLQNMFNLFCSVHFYYITAIKQLPKIVILSHRENK